MKIKSCLTPFTPTIYPPVLEAGGAEWASNRKGVKPKENRLHFPNPNGSGNVIEWHSIKKSPQTWPEVPLILDVESGRLVIFSSVFKAGGCNVYSKYLYQNGAWVEEKLPAAFEQRATNLFLFRSKDKQNFINLEAKRKNISNAKSQNKWGQTRKYENKWGQTRLF